MGRQADQLVPSMPGDFQLYGSQHGDPTAVHVDCLVVCRAFMPRPVQSAQGLLVLLCTLARSQEVGHRSNTYEWLCPYTPSDRLVELQAIYTIQ